TGHEWDGIKELNKPLPRWWVWTFYATILWAIGYWVVYPAWPTLSGYTKGMFGYSQRAVVAGEIGAARAAQGQLRDKLAVTPLNRVTEDPDLLRFAMAGGAAAFQTNCGPCHGRGAQGFAGYPNLNDDSWVWGGTPEQILQTITHGVRDATSDQTRLSEMPAFGRDSVLNAAQIGETAAFVRQLSGQETDQAKSGKGAQIYAENCASCHGEKGEGNAELGGPQLNDAIWLYGGEESQIAAQIRAPRHGMMPAWAPRLGETVVKELAVYVHSLGGGQ
ncbi:MAG: cytochrome-c oxidase, cbb3-type subunit III, partial [Rhodospirillales bacterium]|nr:cytochrome-c oxidase, cbb3-type subunit III [Rhodospirillales bacterium]